MHAERFYQQTETRVHTNTDSTRNSYPERAQQAQHSQHQTAKQPAV